MTTSRRVAADAIQPYDSSRSVQLKSDLEHTVAVLETIRADSTANKRQGPTVSVPRYQIGLYDFQTNDSLGHAPHRGLPGGATHWLTTGPGRMTVDLLIGVLDSDDLLFTYNKSYKPGLPQESRNIKTAYINFAGTRIVNYLTDVTVMDHPAFLDALTLLTDVGKRDNISESNKVSVGEVGVVSTLEDAAFTITRPGIWKILIQVSAVNLNTWPGFPATGGPFRVRLVDDSGVTLCEASGIMSPEYVHATERRFFLSQGLVFKHVTTPLRTRLYVTRSGGQQVYELPHAHISFTRVGPAALAPVDAGSAP